MADIDVYKEITRLELESKRKWLALALDKELHMIRYLQSIIGPRQRELRELDEAIAKLQR